MKRHLVFNICLYLLVILVLFCSCATEKQSMSKDLMMSAAGKEKAGNLYDGIKIAIRALDYDAGNKDGAKFLLKNGQDAMQQAIKSLDQIPCTSGNLPHFKKQAEDILKTQQKLEQLNLIKLQVRDINAIIATCENNVSLALISAINSSLASRDNKNALTLINKYKELKLPINDNFTNCINSLQKLYLAAINSSLANRDKKNALALINKYKELKLSINDNFTNCVNSLQKLYIAERNMAMLVPFIKQNVSYIKDDILNSTLTCLYDPATDKRNTPKKKQAFEVCLFLNEMDNGNQIISNKVKEIKQDLFTFIGVLVVENPSGDLVPVSDDEITSRIINGLDNRELFVEVIDKDALLDELRAQDVNFEYFKPGRFGKADIQIDHNIRYLIVLEIRSLKIQRQQPIVRTKPAYFNPDGVGQALAVGIAMSQAYGKYKVQYFEYDEYTEKANGKIVGRFLVYDVIRGKIVLKDRYQNVVKDTAIWAENPMAVGIVNKIPARIYPGEIQPLLDARKSTKDDDKLGSELVFSFAQEIVVKVNKLLKN